MPPTTEELNVALQKAETERDDAVAKATKLAKKLAKVTKTDGPELEKIDKSALPAAVRDALEKAETDAKDTRDRLKKAEKIAKEERDRRVESEFIAKAESEFPQLGDPKELGPELRRMSEAVSKEDFDSHLVRLTAANEQIAKGDLYREFGRGGEPPVGDTGAVDVAKLQKAAEEIRKADMSLSPYEAMHLAMTQDRESQARYLSNVR